MKVRPARRDANLSPGDPETLFGILAVVAKSIILILPNLVLSQSPGVLNRNDLDIPAPAGTRFKSLDLRPGFIGIYLERE